MNQVAGSYPSFSIFDLIKGVLKRMLLVLSCLGLGLLFGLAIITFIKPTYQTEVRLLIDNMATPYDRANINVTERDAPIDLRTISSQVAVLQSKDLALRTVTALGLESNPKYGLLDNGISPTKEMLISWGFSDDPRLMTAEQRAVDKVIDKLTVYPFADANVIGIKFAAADGKTAADIANTLAEKYVQLTREATSGTNDRAREWLSTQIVELRKKVQSSDAAVETFRAEAGLFKGATATLGAQETSELNTQITLAEVASSEATARANEIRQTLETRGNVDASSDVLSSPIIQSLRAQQVTVERKVSELSATYLPNHPKMLAASKEGRDIESRIRREALKIVDGLQGQAKIAAARASSLRKSLETMKQREGGSLQDDVKLKELEREAKANRDQLESMLARFADSNTRQNMDLQPGFARIIQKATVSTSPSFPRVGPVMLLASFAGLCLGVGLAFLMEIMAQAARVTMPVAASPQMVRQHPARHMVDDDEAEIPPLVLSPAPWPKKNHPPATEQAPVAAETFAPTVLATIPRATNPAQAAALLAAMSTDGAMKQTVEQLCSQVLSLRQSENVQVFALASLGAGAEAAVSTLALARTLVDNGAKVILVDLDAANNRLAELMQLPMAPGLTDLLSGSADFSKTIQRDKSSNLQFLRHGTADSNDSKQLAARMPTITQTLTGIYDIVLLHVGEASPTMLQMAKGSGAVLMTAAAERKRDAMAAGGTLKSNGYKHVFIVDVEGPLQAAA
jgi:polysaccharide biosynthesis transport protein